MRTKSPLRFPLLALAAAAALTGCDGTNTLDDSQITIQDLSDDFSWSVAGLDEVSDGRRYLWTVTGTQIAVDVTQSISGGSAFLQIRDGLGTVVYAENIGDEVDADSDVGVAGLWQIDIVLTKVSGGFGFRAQRTP